MRPDAGRAERPAADAAGAHDEGRGHRRRRQRPVRRPTPCATTTRSSCSTPRRAVGGHVKTVAVDDAGRSARRGHRLHRLQRDDVPDASSACSPSSASRRSRATCRSARPAGPATWSSARAASRGWFARPTAAASPGHWRMFADILRFYRDAREPARRRVDVSRRRSAITSTISGFGRGFRDHFLMPITSAVWSTGTDRILDFPVDYLLRFLDNHGLIGVGRALQWRTITGGSMTYVERIVAAPGPRCRPGRRPGGRRRRGRDLGVIVRTGAVASDAFDAVVMATHADDALPSASRRRRARAGRPRQVRVLRPTGSSSTPTAVAPAAPARRVGLVERRPDGLPASRRRADDDVPHEPAPVAARTGRVLRLGQPGRPARSRSRDPGRREIQPPAVHVPDARRAGGPARRSRAGDGPGTPGPTWLRVPRGRLPIRASRWPTASRPRPASARHEVAPARGQGPPPPRAPVVYALEHDVYYFALDLDELDEVRSGLRLVGRNRRNLFVVPRRRPPRPARRRPARGGSASTSARRGRSRPAGGSRSSRTCACFGYVFNPASFYLCRDPEGTLQVVVVEVHNTHGERHLYTLRPRDAAGTVLAAMDKDFYVSPFIEMARPLHGPRPRRGVAPADRDQRGAGRRACSSTRAWTSCAGP